MGEVGFGSMGVGEDVMGAVGIVTGAPMQVEPLLPGVGLGKVMVAQIVNGGEAAAAISQRYHMGRRKKNIWGVVL